MDILLPILLIIGLTILNIKKHGIKYGLGGLIMALIIGVMFMLFMTWLKTHL